ncbi:molybdopterin-dependent oxidoreductase [Neobacillus vireti]|uniref:molybdopterin-dependent oxidoreductase n=1 Tax=Neobacillus vireti TaxID=220686 RepID=UPI002FFE15AF
MSDKNIFTQIGERKLSRRSLLKWTGIASVPVIAGGVWSTKYLSENKNIVEASETIVPTCSTLDCGGKCMIKAHVRDGVITRISARTNTDLDEANPYMKACVRGRSYRKNQYHPDRLKYPMKRVGKRGEGEFERITWEEAVATITKETKRITEQYGPAARYVHQGTAATGGTIGGAQLARRLMTYLTITIPSVWAIQQLLPLTPMVRTKQEIVLILS